MKIVTKLQFSSLQISESLSFSHVFQPIFSLQDDKLYGYESLLRGKNIQNPEVLFALAEQQDKLYDLDISSVLQSIITFDAHLLTSGQAPYLSVNVFPSSLLKPSFLWMLEGLMRKVNLPSNRIMLELNEAETVQDLTGLQEMVHYLKSAGFIIALDDLGKGYSSLRMALELQPDAIKLDRYFCIDLEHSLKKQRFLDWIVSYFKEEGISVTLEGIETHSQLDIARQVGVPYGQGYILGRPQPLIKSHIMK
ncbi:EAL domain-containing protein [Peribacillus saganii]|nr:EAL domain-containing protein [Peribacillus saganii]